MRGLFLSPLPSLTVIKLLGSHQLVGKRWFLSVVFIDSPLVMREVEHLIIYLKVALVLQIFPHVLFCRQTIVLTKTAPFPQFLIESPPGPPLPSPAKSCSQKTVCLSLLQLP